MTHLPTQPPRPAPICAALLLLLAAQGRAEAAPGGTATEVVGGTVGELQYLAAAPTGEVDAFGLLINRATFDPHDHSGVDLLLVQGNATGRLGAWSARSSLRLVVNKFVPSWSDTKLFFQELYGSWRHSELGEVRVGKIYQSFGRDWDYGFNGPLLSNNDLKLRPDVGISLGGTPELGPRADLQYALQFFLADGQAFGSLTGDGWGTDVRHRNTVVVNVAPGLNFGDGVSGRVGLSGKLGQSRRTAEGQGTQGLVRALALDVDAQARDFGAFFEVGRQFDDSTNLTDATVNFDTRVVTPAFTYVWAAAKYSYGPAKLRLSYNDTFYADAERETVVVPGLSYQVAKNLEVLAEFNLWLTNNVEAAKNTYNSRFRDRALYIVLSANI